MRISQSILPQIPLALARTGAVIRRNRVRLLWIIYTGLFSWAAVRRFSLPLDPVLDTDVIGYLGPALSYLNGGSFTHVNGLNFLYPGALLLILKTVHDLRAIVIVQHLLGLAAGVIFLRAWNRLHDLCPFRGGRGVHETLGVVGAAILLLSNRPIFLELRLRSDAVCIFFQLLTLWLTLEFFYSRLVLCEARKALAYGCAAVASAWLLASLKPSFFLFALLTIAIVIWISSVRFNWRHQLIFGASVAAIILVITLPEQFLRRTDGASGRFLPATLFAVHAKLIQTQMQKDLQSGETGNYSPAWLLKAGKELDENVVRAHEHAHDTTGFRLLGFHPDWILNGPDDLAGSWARDLGGEEPLLNFLRYYYWRALLHQPFAFARKVAAQMLIFYTRPCPAFSIRKSVLLAPRYYLRSNNALQRTSMLPTVGALDFGRSYLARIDSLSRMGVRKIQEGAAVAGANVVLAQLYSLVVLGGSLIALWLLFFHSSARGGVSAPLLTIFLCLPNLANTLGISVVHTMEVDRYAYVQFGAALLSELWILCCLLALSLTRMNRFRSGMSARRAPPFPPGASENNLATQ